MKKILAAVGVAAAMAMAPSAQAATCVDPGTETCTITPADNEFTVSGNIFSGPVSATIGRSGISAGNFIDTYLFEIPQTGTGSGSISTSASGGLFTATDLDFTSVTVNGLAATLSTNGLVEFAGITGVPIVPGVVNRIVVSGLSRGQGSYGGNASFTPAATPGVPEPSTWAMMLFGFGAVGFGMRRRKSEGKTARVRFAF
jgi:hypothetical protein